MNTYSEFIGKNDPFVFSLDFFATWNCSVDASSSFLYNYFFAYLQTQEMQSQSPKVEKMPCASMTEAKNPLTRSSTKNNALKNVSKKNNQTASRNLSLPAMTPRKTQSKKLSTDQHKH